MTTTKIATYRHEKPLFLIVAAFSLLFWTPLVVFGIYQPTFGAAMLAYLASLYLFFLVAHSALISMMKGNAVRLGAEQFPDLHARLLQCCERVGLDKVPETYLMSGNGALNAFATRFLNRYYVVLLSDIVDALEDDPEAINFYIGHELGHIHRKHLMHAWWTSIGRMLPIVGAAYRRAEEYTCDNYGRACCTSRESAVHALAVLAAGTGRWKMMNAKAYAEQCTATGGFWMSINEITDDYPWLCKRLARVHDDAYPFPRRNPLAWLLAAFMPRLGPGGLMMNLIFMVFIVGMLAAIALPQYQTYVQRRQATVAFAYGEALTKKAEAYFVEHQTFELPQPLSELGVAAPETDVVEKMEFDPESHALRLVMRDGKFIEYYAQAETEEVPASGRRKETRTHILGVTGWECTTSFPQKAIPRGVECLSFDNPFGAFGGSMDGDED